MWSDSEAGHGNDGAFGRSSVTGSRGGLGGSFAASGGRAFQGERSLRRSLGSLHSRTGGVDPRPRGGKTRSLWEPHLAWLLDLTIAEPDLTLEAIVQSLLAGLGLKTSEAADRRFFKRHAITFKKALHAAEQDRPDVSLARERWKASQASLDPPQAGVRRLDGRQHQDGPHLRAMSKGRATRLQDPWGHWKTTTFTCGLRCDGLVATWVLEGPMTGDAFLIYVE